MDFSFLALLAFSSFFYKTLAQDPPDVCLLQVDRGPCRAIHIRYHYNTITQQCEQFLYGGCLGNANNFRSQSECYKTCSPIPQIPQPCRYPMVKGPCAAAFTRFFFNMTSMQCEIFKYGGCRGNANRFLDFQSCYENCSPRKTLPPMCLDPVDIGYCSASIPRFYYNKSSKTCRVFSYSGCGGNRNKFVSWHNCVDTCVLDV
ncbi:tissue factor pathway inhibitor 2-like [Stigmatopora nigra]